MVTTLTETVAGEIVTLIFVTGSVQVEVEVVVEEVDVVLVHVTAVLAGAAPQEVRPSKAPPRRTRASRRFTAALSWLTQILNARACFSILVRTISNPTFHLKSCFPCCARDEHPHL